MQRVTSEEVSKRALELKDAIMKKTPIDNHPFLSLAVAFGIGFLLSQATSGNKEEDSRANPFFEKLFALLTPVVLERISKEIE